MRFSQRHGFTPIKNIIQKDSIDDGLKNKLWNALTIFYWNKIGQINFDITEDRFFKLLWHEFFKMPIDTLGTGLLSVIDGLKEYFYSCEWYEIYDFIEFLANNYPDNLRNTNFINFCNSIFKDELSAYRFVGGKITPITSEEEISTIEESLKQTGPLKLVNIHLKAALEHLTNRKSPNYRNSIKESISSIEAFCNLLTEKSTTLGQCIKILEQKLKIHPAFKESLSKLYGWTSDAEGIRHGLMDEPNLEFEDAKFILVTCSAFINFLIAKGSKAGIEFLKY